MNDLIERKSIRNLYSCLNPNDRVLVGQVLIDIDAIPSAEVPTTMTGVIDAIREAEYRGCMKAVEERPKGEWASVLAELHERFDALEKEIRKASAEMSAMIRKYVDRPQGEWQMDEDDDIYHCSKCFFEIDASGCIDPTEYISIYNFCPNCGSDNREREDE